MEAEITNFGSDGEGSITDILWRQSNGADKFNEPEVNLVASVLIDAIELVVGIGRREGKISREMQREIDTARAWIAEDTQDDFFSFNGAWGLIFGDQFPAEKARQIILADRGAIARRRHELALLSQDGIRVCGKRYAKKMAKIRGGVAA